MLKKQLLFLTVLLASCSFGQLNDSLTHNVNRAALWSTFIPGAGQIYNEFGYRRVPHKKNRAWWKVPIIYGGLGVTGYYFYQNNKFAALTKKEYKYQVDNPGTYLDERFKDYPTDETGAVRPLSLINGYKLSGVEYKGFEDYASNRDLFAVAFIAVWGLNVLEAYVDAHFVTFDVSENLTMSFKPTLLNRNTAGLNVTFNFD